MRYQADIQARQIVMQAHDMAAAANIDSGVCNRKWEEKQQSNQRRKKERDTWLTFSTQPTQEEKDKGLTTVFKRDDKALKRRGTDDREKDPAFVSDTYSGFAFLLLFACVLTLYVECYPGAFETAMYACESDDEEDLTKMGIYLYYL